MTENEDYKATSTIPNEDTTPLPAENEDYKATSTIDNPSNTPLDITPNRIPLGIETTAYKTSSDSELQNKFRNTVSIPQNIRGALAKAGDTIRDAEQTAATALALTFSSVGIVKSVIPISSEGGRITGIGRKVNNSLVNQKNRYLATSSDLHDITSTNENDYIFRISDYYLPLSYNFSINASKNIVKSQLVDGQAIYEMTSYNPAEIILRIKLERKPLNDNGIYDAMSFRQNQGTTAGDVVKFATVINDLYKNKSVFAIYNNFTNKDVGIQFVVLARYTIDPTEGSTVTNITLNLLEVNLTSQTLFVEKQ